MIVFKLMDRPWTMNVAEMTWYLNALKINRRPGMSPPSGHNPPRRGGGAGEQSYSDANRWRGKREPSPRRARPIEITVCADQGDARRRCMDMPVQLDRVGGFEKSPKSPQ